MGLFAIAVAPVIIIAFYLYYRDKYEKEPFWWLVVALIAGGVVTLPVIFFERILELPMYYMQGYLHAGWNAFVVAAFTEELFKFVLLLLIFWNNPTFNEKFDGIVYASFISLGFAAVENLLYVINGGFQVGLTRAFTAVPAPALFGIIMGYRVGLAKFYPKERKKQLSRALFMPMLFHGIYDFILMTGHPYLVFAFLPFLVFLWIYGFKRLKNLSDRSIYRWLSPGKPR
jgi:RsiW-degrading membrane proteinase PrsW (M82 family)